MWRLIISLLFCSALLSVSGQEICDNGIDDDGNGMIDLNDTACVCSGFGSSQTISSLIPNSSFEDRSCCPTTFSQLNCADTWIQASNPTSDYWHDCGSGFAPAYGDPGPKPDGQGMAAFIDMGSYKEYVGACLLSPMLTNTSYTLDFYVGMVASSLPMDMTIYGTPNCGDLPFNDGCPVGEGSWVELGNVNVSGSGWLNVQVTFSPTQDINAMVIGPPCTPNNGSIAYYYVDGLTLAETSGFGSVTITESGGFCSNDLVLNATADTSGTWQWFKDGVALVGETSPTIDISTNGYGTGTYTARIANGAKCETNDYVVEPPSKPIASFTTDTVCAGQPIQFFDFSSDTSGTITNWQWDFNNDGLIDSTSQNPTFIYPISGTFTATLIVTNNAGCKDTVTSAPGYTPGDSTSAPLVIVSPNPTADFTFDTVCIGNQTTFTDNSSGAIISTWEWTIDGTTNNNQNPTYTFSSVGPFLTKLKVTSNIGCVDSITKNVILETAPNANFSFTGVCDNETFVFSNLTTVQGLPAPNNYTYLWDFGDMTTSTGVNPTKSYTSGTYNVTLTALSPSGCQDDTIQTITVYPTPVADFTFNEVCFNEATTLTDQSTTPNGGSIISYNWNIEGNPFTSQNQVYTFSSPGVSPVTLSITTADGCMDSVTNLVTVYQLPIANFDYSPQELTFFETNVCFDDLSINADLYAWGFDFVGGQSVQPNPCVEFPKLIDGDYDVQLVVQTVNGCFDSITRTIRIEEGLTVNIPNSFTPDGDGNNDVFQPIYMGVSEAELYIFNRWGQLVFVSDRVDAAWDGTYKNEAAKEDVYVYRIILRDLYMKKHIYNGHVNLLR